MTRWKAIGILVLSVAFLSMSCNAVQETQEDRDRRDGLLEQDAAASELESVAPEDGDSPSDDEADPGQSDAAQDDDETAQPPSGSTTTTMRTDGVDPANDQTDGSGNVVLEGEGNPGGDIVAVRHEPGPAEQQCFIIDVVKDGQETSKAPQIYYVAISWMTPEGEEGLATVEYDNGPPDAKLRSSDQGRPEIEGTLVTAEWENSETLRVCVDGGETKVEVESFRVQIDIFLGLGSWTDSALGLAG